jgi:hypothetical protein
MIRVPAAIVAIEIVERKARRYGARAGLSTVA